MLLLSRHQAAALRPLVGFGRALPSPSLLAPCSACSTSPFSTSTSTSTSTSGGGSGVVLGCGSNVVDVISRVRALPQAGEKGYFADPEVLVSAQIVGGVTLNHLAWASALGVPTGLFALQGAAANGSRNIIKSNRNQ